MSSKRWRSLLFAPANRTEFTGKLARSGPDAVVLDLEDAVPPSAKGEARSLVEAAAAQLSELDGGPTVMVRINGTRTEWIADDLESLTANVHAVMVPKLETVSEVHALRAALDALDLGHVGIVAGIETVLGVADARAVLASGVVGAYFGAEDFVNDLGGVRTTGNGEVAWARAQISVAARLAGIQLADMVVTDIHDGARFTLEAAQARALGYTGKLCIHPTQVPLANAAFVPTPAEVERARRLIAAYDASVAGGVAAIAFEGQMVDEPVARRAREVLLGADATGTVAP